MLAGKPIARFGFPGGVFLVLLVVYVSIFQAIEGHSVKSTRSWSPYIGWQRCIHSHNIAIIHNICVPSKSGH